MAIPPMKIEFAPEDRIEVLRRIDRCMATGRMAQGENVQEFEAQFARYVSARDAVAVSSGGAALEVAMRLLDVAGREVLVPTNTFAATAMSVLLAGGRVRFVDAAADTFGVSIDGLRRAVTPDTVGVIVVHVGGIISPEIDAIAEWCRARGLWLFEDAAHAHGSRQVDRMAGRFGIGAAYSFFATKVMTSGEGGMLVTDDEDFAQRARGLRDYGKPDPWVSYHTAMGTNWRMHEFAAAAGVVQLGRLDEFIAAREKVAEFYTRALAAAPALQPVLPAGRSSWYKYIVLLPAGIDRDKLKTAITARGVQLAGGVYETPLHRQPIFAGPKHLFPVANDVCARHICLPIYYGMTDNEANQVLDACRAALVEQGVRL